MFSNILYYYYLTAHSYVFIHVLLYLENGSSDFNKNNELGFYVSDRLLGFDLRESATSEITSFSQRQKLLQKQTKKCDAGDNILVIKIHLKQKLQK